MDNAKIVCLISLGLGLFSFFYEYAFDALIFGIGGIITGMVAYRSFNKSQTSNIPAIVVIVINVIAILFNMSFL